MRNLMILLGVLTVSIVVWAMWWSRVPPFDGHPPAVEMELVDVTSQHDVVRVRGEAHYPVRASRTWPKTLFKAEETLWFFPLFTPGDTSSTHIVTMVASPIEPDRGHNFGVVTIDGWVRPPRARIDNNLEKAFRRLGYTFEADYLLLEQLVD